MSMLDEVVDHICRAAPLAWVANGNIDGAQQWEKEALELIRETQAMSDRKATKYRTTLVPRHPSPGTLLTDEALEGLKNQLLSDGAIPILITDDKGAKHDATIVEARITEDGIEAVMQVALPFDFKKRRHELATGGFKAAYGGVSMGCKVAESTCPTCSGKVTTPTKFDDEEKAMLAELDLDQPDPVDPDTCGDDDECTS